MAGTPRVGDSTRPSFEHQRGGAGDGPEGVKRTIKVLRSAFPDFTIVWSLTSPEIHRLFRVDRAWSAERYAEWLGQTLTRTLLP